MKSTAFPLEATEQSIAARFEQQASLFSQCNAITVADESINYDALNRLSNQYARAILSTYPDSQATRVAIYFEKGIQYIAAILGTLKAGHIYVPIDPAFPQARNDYIVHNSETKILLTNTCHLQAATELGSNNIEQINLDTVSNTLDDRNLELNISPDSLAYIIYTSGSTGKPKGVMQNHRNTLHGCMRRTHLQKITPDDHISLFYSCSVMGSVYCIFAALLNGASLFPYDFREQGLDELETWLKNHKITVYHSVASVFRQFATTYKGNAEGFFIRLVIFGGERVLTQDIELARSIFSHDIRFFTGLGSTETGTIRHFLIDPTTTINTKVVPIGYPIEGVDVVLLNEQGLSAQKGEIGEITVKSQYISPGYWNNPKTTAQVFESDPHNSNIKIYHMGDMAELMPGDLLEHRGRKDFQVKIRGFRVEIGEVETALLHHNEIAETVVTAQEVGQEYQLVAYLVSPNNRHNLNVRELRKFLGKKLPHYMIPTVFVELNEIPKTPNNKVDRNALPQPLPSNELIDDICTPAANKTEQKLIDICKELLRRTEMGSNQNFFDYGGDSLSATQLVSRINAFFHIKISMRTAFEAEDLKQLAASIHTATPKKIKTKNTDLIKAPYQEKPLASLAQKRMWLIDQLNEGTAAYNISNTVALKGQLNISAMEQSLNDIIKRHEVLRTVFPSNEEGPWQEVKPFSYQSLTVVNLCGLSNNKQAEALKRVNALLQKPHNLAKGPLLFFELIQLNNTEYILSLVFNHIIYDNIWSSGIFFKELGNLYECYSKQNSTAALAPLDFQFVDYAVWEQARITQSEREQHINYWKPQLANPPDLLQIPSDRLRLNKPSFKGEHVVIKIPAPVRLALTHFTRAESATMFMSLLAIWQLLLHRYSNQNDILVGTPTGRRYHTKTESMIGLFINNLVMRTNFEGNISFRELLQRVRKVSIDAFSHDELPFEQLVAELKPERTVGTSPFFQHFFIHRNATNARWEIPGLEVTPLKNHQGGSKFDLTLSVLETEQNITGTFEYSSDLFDHETIERMAANYIQLLTAAIEAPDIPVWNLALIAPVELRHIKDEGNKTAVDYPQELSTHQLFEQQAHQKPKATAIIFDAGKLTYSELNRCANLLAAELQALGVKPDTLVAVCLNRGAELIISLLAILKAGGAYVPLDPGFPAERLKHMVEDSKAPVFISEPSIAPKFTDLKAQLLIVDPDSDIFKQPKLVGEVQNITNTAGPQNLAYVIYTSGSTGKPKGVQLTRQALVNFLLSMQKEPGIGSEDVLQSLTTVCFDISALELFLPLITGAAVVIKSREASMSPDELIKSLNDNAVTIMQATPVTWRMLLDNGWTGTPKLKVLCGGEAMGSDLAEKLLETGCEIWNLYGPTETTIWSSVNQIKTKADACFIGHSIANTQLYVFSPKLTLEPIGVPGELLIGGDGLARGYFNLPAMTGEKFITSPLDPNKRLYRTGDLVVRRIDGEIEFLGRIDNQVKIRGFRIELGDIESQLAAHPEIKHGVVIAREDNPGDKKLVAYYVAETPNKLSIEMLREFLQKSLPSYMIPSVFVCLGALPQTANGKVDRKNLPFPPQAITTLNSNCEDKSSNARHDLDLGLISAWEETLKIENISIDDDFFALGGDSMSAIRLIKNMQKAVGISFSPLSVFEFRTIRLMLDKQGADVDSAASIVKLNASNTGTPIYCLCGVELYKTIAEHFKDSPVYGVYAKKEIEALQQDGSNQQLRVPIDDLVNTYTSALKRHINGGKVILIGLSFGGLMALEVTQKLKAEGYNVTHTILLDSLLPNTYTRSIEKMMQDIIENIHENGVWNTAIKLASVIYIKTQSTIKRKMHKKFWFNKENRAKQTAVFRGMVGTYNSAGKHYAFNTLLIKATKKHRGFGVIIKEDCGFKEIIFGTLTIADVAADHIGMVKGTKAKDIYNIVSDYISH